MRTTVLVLALSMAACSPEANFGQGVETPDAGFPEIEVDPPLLHFGELTSLEEAVRTFTVRNKGYSILDLEEIVISGDPSFGLVALPELPVGLLHDETTTFDVAFQPQGNGDLFAQVVVSSDAHGVDDVTVDLRGVGATPMLEIDPPAFDFGEPPAGCGSNNGFTLRNVGREPLVLTDVGIADESLGLRIVGELPLPVTLEWGESINVPVAYAPNSLDLWTTTLDVTSTDPRGVQSSGLQGGGVPPVIYTDTWLDGPELDLDILLAVDRSCSMGDQTSILALKTIELIDVLGAADVDWRLGILTDDLSACFQEGILSADVATWRTDLVTAVNSGGHRLTEAHLESLALGVAQDTPGGCNEGFHRPATPIQIFMISDEADQSDGWTGASDYWRHWYDAVVAYAQGPLVYHGIVDTAGACGEVPEGATGYTEVIAESGGRTLDVCGDWPSAFDSLTQASLEAVGRAFPLTRGPIVPSSLDVRIDGVPQLTGWAYESTFNSVLFDTRVPPERVVSVSYELPVDCPF